jgi:ribonuclease HI
MWNATAGGPPPPSFQANHPSAFEHESFVDQAIEDLLATHAAMELSHPPTVVAPLGVAIKKGSGKLRLIWDGRYVNDYLHIPNLNYETLGFLREVLELYDYLFTIDLKAGYHHMDVLEDHWQYLGFSWKNRFFCFTQLPFGLATACWGFSRMMRAVLAVIKAQGIRCSGYIDDSIYASQSVEELLSHRHFVLTLLFDLGLLVNFDKSKLVPTRMKPYLGMEVDTGLGVFRVPTEKRDRLLADIGDALLHSAGISARKVASIKGQLMAMGWAFGPMVHFFTRALELDVPYRTNKRAWDQLVVLSDEAITQLQFWRTCFNQFNGTHPMWRPSHVHTIIHTDAAGRSPGAAGGWGAWLAHAPDAASRTELVYPSPHAFTQPFMGPQAHGAWDSAASVESSTWQELQAVANSITAFNRHGAMRGKNVEIVTDNQNVCSAIDEGKVHAPKCVKATQDIFLYCASQNIHLSTTWVPRGLNAQADSLSKMVDGDDIMLLPSTFARLSQAWGPFSVDLFASDRSHQLPCYYTRRFTPGSAGVNAFCHPWSTTSRNPAWAFPPFSILSRVWQHARALSASLVLIVPHWPTSPWWKYVCPRGSTGGFAAYVLDYQVLPAKPAGFLAANPGGAMVPVQPFCTACLALRISFEQPRSNRLAFPCL